MNLRKLFAILLALLVVLSFAACDGGGGGGGDDDNGGGSEVPAPLCFTASGGDVDVIICLRIEGDPDDFLIPKLEWSSDGEEWEPVTISTPEALEIETYNTIATLTSGDKVYIRAASTNEYFAKINEDDTYMYASFCFDWAGTGTVEASGNVMSLLDGTRTLTEIPSEYCFSELFSDCDSLTKAPELPATTLASHCYDMMFSYCTSLTTAPELPAVTLASHCYDSMFWYCTSLTTAPKLPATTLVKSCYEGMFYACKSLNSIEVGFTSWGNTEAGYEFTRNWVNGVSDEGDFECSEELAPDLGVHAIPRDWTINGST